MSDWEDQPLFDMGDDRPAKKPKKKYLTWTMLKHNRFVCEVCVELLHTEDRNGIKHAAHLREDEDGTRVYCNEHAADQKMDDQKNGKWRLRG